MKRRDFLMTAATAVTATGLTRTAQGGQAQQAGPERPNVLWISTEDISPDLGCYGDAYALTPNLDAFAKQGTRFDNAFAHMGVCAPARSGIITGCYPTWLGTNHMRCKGVPPAEVKCFPEYLRAVGYWCTNRSKTDYQFSAPFTAWDTSGKGQDWAGRAEGQPFFSVINLTLTHESRIRSEASRKAAEERLTPAERHDPAKAPVPPYHPDTPIVRHDWAQYADNITMMDKDVAAILKRLEEDGLAEDTIVWFWGDHGRGLPRGKRWIYDSGLRVPLIIRVPEKWRRHVSPDDPAAVAPGTVAKELVSFVDFAPTMLSLCGVPIPQHMQGQAFCGPQKAPPRKYVYAARDRVDEAYDMIRAVGDGRFKYLRNFMAHLPRSLDINYMNQMPTMQEMRRLNAEGKLKGAERQYFECPKPIEELYDTRTDPHEVNNLAADPKHAATLARMREALFAWMKQTGDFGLLPECEFDALKWPGGEIQVTATPGVRINGQTVELVCLTPGASLGYRLSEPAADSGGGGQFFSVAEATMHGKGAKVRGGEVSGWRDPKTWFSWEAEITTAGKLPVHVYQAYGRGDSGCPYVLSVGEAQVEGTVKKTRGWDDYQFVKVGEVEIPKPGKYTLSIKPKDTTRPYSMNLRAVVLNGTDLKPPKASSPSWRLYTGPLKLTKGQRVEVKACRLGFKDSQTIRYTVGDPPPAAERPAHPPHWRQVVDDSGVIDRALSLKRLDGQPEKALPAYRQALTGATRDPAGAVRYWAVLGLHTHAFTLPFGNDSQTGIEIIRTCLNDPSPAVRIAAAHALCDWGETDRGLPVLVEALKEPQDSTKLLAATALNHLGEKARPVLADVQSLAKGGYAGRMAQTIAAHLKRP